MFWCVPERAATISIPVGAPVVRVSVGVPPGHASPVAAEIISQVKYQGIYLVGCHTVLGHLGNTDINTWVNLE